MLRSVDDLRGRPIAAVDGELGKADDFLFDDTMWVVRYLVVDVGGWLSNRKVLISPIALGEPRQVAFEVNLTMEQVRNSPDIDTAKTISRQQEERLRAYYGWPVYWEGSAVMGAEPVIPVPPGGENVQQRREQEDRQRQTGERETPAQNLRSVRAVSGYHIAAADGELGHVSDFVVDDTQWYLRYLVIDTRNWLPGRKVLASPEWVKEIEWAGAKVYLDVTRDQVKNAPEYDPAAPVNREYEEVLYDYYGRPRYW